MVRVSRDPWIDSTHTGIGSLVLNLEINILVVSYPHSSLQYGTVYSVHVFMYPNFTPAKSTVQCTCIHVSLPHSRLYELYRVQCTYVFIISTFTSDYNTVQNKNIHVSYSHFSPQYCRVYMHPCILPLPFIANELYSVSHFSLKYCTVFMYPCILTSLQPIVLYSVHVFMYPTFTPAFSTVQCTCIHAPTSSFQTIVLHSHMY